jgi:hypothetical protein
VWSAPGGSPGISTRRRLRRPTGLRAATLPFGQRSMAGSSVSVTMGSVDSFRVNGFRGDGGAVRAAIHDLHAVDDTKVVNQRAGEALAALDIVNNAPITTRPTVRCIPPVGVVAIR